MPAPTLRALMLSLLLSGCASVPMASTAADAQAKTFRPAAGQASLYVYRPKTFKLRAITVNVMLDGHGLGTTKVGTFLQATVPAGPHTLLSQSESEVPVLVQAEPNQSYFFEQKVSFGVRDAQTTLIRVEDAVGRAAVLACDRAASQPPVAAPASAGCSKDTDCKGNRVCNAGLCSEPPPP